MGSFLLLEESSASATYTLQLIDAQVNGYTDSRGLGRGWYVLQASAGVNQGLEKRGLDGVIPRRRLPRELRSTFADVPTEVQRVERGHGKV